MAAFVYQGAGKKVGANAERSLRECKQEACDIQWCLAKSNTNFTRCEPAIAAWRRCHDRARQADAAASAAQPQQQQPQQQQPQQQQSQQQQSQQQQPQLPSASIPKR